jgi:predicted transcriptional regulator
MSTTPFSIRFDAKLKARLEKEAKRRDRPVGYIVNRAVKSYFGELDRLEKELDDAVAEADKGIFISGEKVFEWMRSWGTENELPPPEPDIFPEAKTGKKKAA